MTAEQAKDFGLVDEVTERRAEKVRKASSFLDCVNFLDGPVASW